MTYTYSYFFVCDMVLKYDRLASEATGEAKRFAEESLKFYERKLNELF